MHWKLASLKNSTVFVLSSCNVFVFCFWPEWWMGFCMFSRTWSFVFLHKKGCDMIVLRSFGKTGAIFELGFTLQGKTWWGPCSKWLDGSYKFDSCGKSRSRIFGEFFKDNPELVSSFVKVRRWVVFVFIFQSWIRSFGVILLYQFWKFPKIHRDHMKLACSILLDTFMRILC